MGRVAFVVEVGAARIAGVRRPAGAPVPIGRSTRSTQRSVGSLTWESAEISLSLAISGLLSARRRIRRECGTDERVYRWPPPGKGGDKVLGREGAMIGQSPRAQGGRAPRHRAGPLHRRRRRPRPAPPGLVRSTHARARMVAVDVQAARALPGVTVFLADDLPELDAPLPATYADPTNPYVPPRHASAAAPARARRSPPRRRAHRRRRGARRLPGRRRGRRGPVEYEPLARRGRRRGRDAPDGRPPCTKGASNVVGRVSALDRRRRARVRRGRRDRRGSSGSHGRVSSMALETRGVCAEFDPGDGHADRVGGPPGALRAARARWPRASGCRSTASA